MTRATLMAKNLWYKNAVFYQVYLRAFRDSNGDGYGDLVGLMEKLDYLKNLGVDCIWLMPISPSPLKDDGYDIADFYRIDPVYGTLDDFQQMLDAAHAKGMRVIMDLVMNHTSDQHPWFQSARRDRRSPFRDYYVWSDTDKTLEDARIIFLDVESSNWAWDQAAGQFYWHRFYASQPDLNYDNSRVQEEILDIARFWLAFGIDGLRADAVPYLFERSGTSCENLPETHAYLKKLRAMIDQDFPGSMLLCEANQQPEDVRAYFGNGDEFHMAFHFPVMPRLFMSLGKGMVDDVKSVLQRTPAIPSDTQWCTFLRNHDELTLEMVSDEERQWAWDFYAPEARMRLNLGIRRRLAPLLDNDVRKIRLMYSMLFTLPGSPIIYYGDEIGMGDNIWLPDRFGLRTPMQWDSTPSAGFSAASPDKFYQPLIDTEPFGATNVSVERQQQDAGSIWNSVRHMLGIRKQHPVLAWGALEWPDNANRHVAAFRRRYKSQQITAVHNLTEEPQAITLRGRGPMRDLLTGKVVEGTGGSRRVKLADYEFMWLAPVAGPGAAS
jgi:maltose alpha-D-glucosyltransferase/alpha-amylase